MLKLIFFLLVFNLSAGDRYEKALLKTLFDSDTHELHERPVLLDADPVNVSMRFSLHKILKFDAKVETLQALLFIRMRWNDYHFKWNSSEYGNLNHINIVPNLIWLPDILLYNSADDYYSIGSDGNLVVHSTGEINWKTVRIFKTPCAMDVSWFPFDEQECRLEFGTWSYEARDIRVNLECTDSENGQNCYNFTKANLKNFITNEEFSIADNCVRKIYQTYDDITYEKIILFIKIQRRSLYYTYNLLLPCILTNIMTLMVFKLPPEAGEKITLGVNILLNLTFLLQMVSEKVPQNSISIPLMGIYFVISMILCSLSLVFTVIVLSCHYSSNFLSPPPPKLLMFFSNYLARIVRMKAYNFKSEMILESYHKKAGIIETNLDNEYMIVDKRSSQLSHDIAAVIRPMMPAFREHSHKRSNHIYQKRLRHILSETRSMSGKLKSIQVGNCTTMQWKYIAKILDQAFLYAFSIINFIVTFAFLTSAPNLINSFLMKDNRNEYTNYS